MESSFSSKGGEDPLAPPYDSTPCWDRNTSKHFHKSLELAPAAITSFGFTLPFLTASMHSTKIMCKSVYC